MSDVSLFQDEFKKFGTYDPSTKTYTDGDAFEFNNDCHDAKVDVDEILADLIITGKPEADRTDAEAEKNDRIENVLTRNYTPRSGAAFNPTASRPAKLDWVKKHLDLGEKIAVLAEVQAFESIIDGTNPYPDDVFKARKQRSDAKKDCIINGKNLKDKYENFLTRLKAKIDQDVAIISSKDKEINELSKGVAGEKTAAKVTPQAEARIPELKAQISAIETELEALRSLYAQASGQVDAFKASIDKSLRDNKIFEKDEAKKEDKSEDKGSTYSVKSPYSSLSDRGKQASDSQEAKDLYQSFAAADYHSKFLMLTGLDAHNMLEIARNLAKVGDRKDLQEYCQSMLDSNFIKYNGTNLEEISITLSGGKTIVLPELAVKDLKNGLSDKVVEDIRKQFEKFHTIKLKELSVEDLESIANYSNAILISTTLHESRWGKGKQITKGLLHFPGRKKNPHYDLGNDVAAFLKPLCERKDKIFKEINKEVDKGINSADHIIYGPSTAVQHGQRKYQVRTFDEK